MLTDKNKFQKSPTVFIGMPVYNGERFIREAIESIINQSYPHWKLFISDDCSTDKTPEFCKEFSVIDKRIVYCQQNKNTGIFVNQGFTLDRADSEYFMWAAQDDIREKDYITVCLEHLEKNKNLGFATTVMAAIDSYGRTLIEEKDLLKLSGKPGIIAVARYVLQPEILGKCNLMYGFFRTRVARAVWNAYPMRKVWGPDYMFSLALISRYEIYVDKKVLFKKRLGGSSSPEALLGDRKDKERMLEYKNPKNHMFQYGRFGSYFSGHMEALQGTPYQALAAILLMIRLPRAFLIYLKERNFKKLISKKI